ncbi:hypothetical protein [Streptomyces antarcticus]|uniref:hypothetical protein n=1 Tax=Streptomyces antarcticus TaxID=2996458 RepID=UPI0022712535|nr:MULTISPECIES: hypothetical protein [unclassified Streptomyces]MCY0944815.1 hypothetical protein [Streptomyces sp. H34-AA3]MCZ4081152.1 hypothetical protein [Streptomyces sp. H34-S5]
MIPASTQATQSSTRDAGLNPYRNTAPLANGAGTPTAMTAHPNPEAHQSPPW